MSFDRLPKKPLLRIFSFLSVRNQGKLTRTCKQFNTALNDPLSSLREAKSRFESICKQIESVPHYQPEITAKQIKALTLDENNFPIHRPPKMVLAIKPLNLDKIPKNISRKGRFYQIIRTEKITGRLGDGEMFQKWCVDDSWIVFVDREKAALSFHILSQIKKGNLSIIFPELSLENFLNKEGLHTPKDLLAPCPSLLYRR